MIIFWESPGSRKQPNLSPTSPESPDLYTSHTCVPWRNQLQQVGQNSRAYSDSLDTRHVLWERGSGLPHPHGWWMSAVTESTALHSPAELALQVLSASPCAPMSGKDEGKATSSASSEGLCVTILIRIEELNLKIRCLHISGIDRVRQSWAEVSGIYIWTAVQRGSLVGISMKNATGL